MESELGVELKKSGVSAKLGCVRRRSANLSVEVEGSWKSGKSLPFHRSAGDWTKLNESIGATGRDALLFVLEVDEQSEGTGE